LTDYPAHDEFEISVFGGGYGESISVHIGDGEWVIIDSCLEPTSGQPAAIEYLESIGVDVSQQVVLIVVTHWDDDHIRGMANVVEQCTGAKVAISAALGKKEVLSMVAEQTSSATATGSGVDELREILELCRNTRPPILAKANQLLYAPSGSSPPMIRALSPSDDACFRSFETLIEQATSQQIAVKRRYRAPEGPNGASVASYIDSLGLHVLLGADLEISRNDFTGWNDVVRSANPHSQASLVKVPHHGSRTGHDQVMWDVLVTNDSFAIVAPWIRGGRGLPTEDDLVRLKTLASKVYVTSLPQSRRIRRGAEVATLLRRIHARPLRSIKGWGQVRSRCKLGSSSWNISLFGDAFEVN
jgi:beta-lactamase superfamily II metal-dependent hydrolase